MAQELEQALTPEVTQEILWELCHMSFWFELLSLDALLVDTLYHGRDGITQAVVARSEVFTFPHEFWRNPVDSERNVGIPWNSDGIQMAEASAILVSNGIRRNLMETTRIREPPGTVSIGIHWNSNQIPWNSNGI